jgi:hypothetical protein
MVTMEILPYQEKISMVEPGIFFFGIIVDLFDRFMTFSCTSDKHGTDYFTSPSEERHAVNFSSRKNPTVSVGSEPAVLGTRGQHANP